MDILKFLYRQLNAQDYTMDNQNVNLRRRILQLAVASLLTEVEFDSFEPMAQETLVEITQSLICQIGISAQSYCELSGRTEPVIGDVIVALVNMGISLDGIDAHARRSGRTVLPALVPSTQPKQLNILQAGEKQKHPSHIPTHLPPFPDPHAYIRTPTHKQPVTEYEAIREKSASQKRDTERALTKFVAKTSETHSLFLMEDTIFPLIACKLQWPPYIKALLPSDQVFEFEDEFAVPAIANRTSGANSKTASETERDGKENGDESKGGERDTIDNPYLLPVKMLKKNKPKTTTVQ